MRRCLLLIIFALVLVVLLGSCDKGDNLSKKDISKGSEQSERRNVQDGEERNGTDMEVKGTAFHIIPLQDLSSPLEGKEDVIHKITESLGSGSMMDSYNRRVIGLNENFLLVEEREIDRGFHLGYKAYRIDDNKGITKDISFPGFSFKRIIRHDGRLLIFGVNRKRTISVELEEVAGSLKVILHDAIDGRYPAYLNSVGIFNSSPFMITDEEGDISWFHYVNNKWKFSNTVIPEYFLYSEGDGENIGLPQLHFWQPLYRVEQNVVTYKDKRFLVWGGDVAQNVTDFGNDKDSWTENSGICKLRDIGCDFFSLPQPTEETYSRYRPQDKHVGYIEQNISHFAVQGNKLWFGTSFYEGEGYTGLGGIGYFDLESEAYQVAYFNETARWSTNALFMDENNLILGLAGNPEAAQYSGGLVKYDTESGELKVHRIPYVIHAIDRINEFYVLATNDGVIFLNPDGFFKNLMLIENEAGGMEFVLIEALNQ